jgi:hypothetical protein
MWDTKASCVREAVPRQLHFTTGGLRPSADHTEFTKQRPWTSQLGTLVLTLNWSYLSAAEEDRGTVWLALALNAPTLVLGLLLMVSRTEGGKPLVLSRRPWRYWFLMLISMVCIALFLDSLGLSRPYLVGTGTPLLLIVLALRGLFVPEGSEVAASGPITPAQRRTWIRGIVLLFLAGTLVLWLGVTAWVQGDLDLLWSPIAGGAALWLGGAGMWHRYTSLRSTADHDLR